MPFHRINLDVVQAASERGIAYATWLLSNLCRHGIERPASAEDALTYLKIAAAQGSLHAERDLALWSMSGSLFEITPQLGFEMAVLLVEKGIDRLTLGEKLLFSRQPHLAQHGYKALRQVAQQDGDLRARFLTALFEALGDCLSENNEENLNKLYYRGSRDSLPAARRALALAGMLGLRGPTYTRDSLLEDLLAAGSADAVIDALDLSCSANFEHVDPQIKLRIFNQLEAYARAGEPFAEVIHTAHLLQIAHPRDEGQLALRLMELLNKHPQFHLNSFDHLLHAVKKNDTRVVPAMLEWAQRMVDSGLSPHAHRTLAIELMIHDQDEKALPHLMRAVDLGVQQSIPLVVGHFGREFVNSGKNYEDTRFWHEVYVWENVLEGSERLATLLELKVKHHPMTPEDVLTRKTCLEFMVERKDTESTRELAMMLIRGDGPVLPDPKRGLELLQKAAQTDGRAMYELAHLYQAGVVVPKDSYLAKYYFELAGKHGHSNAIYDDLSAQARAREKKKLSADDGEAIVRAMNRGSLENRSEGVQQPTSESTETSETTKTTSDAS